MSNCGERYIFEPSRINRAKVIFAILICSLFAEPTRRSYIVRLYINIIRLRNFYPVYTCARATFFMQETGKFNTG